MNDSHIEVKTNIWVKHNKKEVPFNSVPHLHSQYEIYYNVSGAKGFMLGGEFYKCGQRDLIIVPKVHSHKVVVKRHAEYERCIINVEEHILELLKLFFHSEDVFDFLTSVSVSSNVVNLSLSEHDEYLKLISEYIFLEEKGKEIELLSKFLEILSFIKRVFENPQKTEYLEDEDVSYSDRVIKIIEKNFRNITVSEIASALYINEDHVNRVFKEETGMTINRYLITRKLAESKKHLYLGKSVKEACFLSGFRDYANFIRTFKKYEGYSPSTLRELTKPF